MPAPARKARGDALRLLGDLLQEGASGAQPRYHPDIVWAIDAHKGGLCAGIRTFRLAREFSNIPAGAYTGRVLIAPRVPLRIHRIQAYVRVNVPPLTLRSITASLQVFGRVVVLGNQDAPDAEVETAFTSSAAHPFINRSAVDIDFDELASIAGVAGRVTYAGSDILVPGYEPGQIALGVAPLVFEWSRVAALNDSDTPVVLVNATAGWGVP